MAGQGWTKNKRGFMVNAEGKTAREVRAEKRVAAKASGGGGGGGGGGDTATIAKPQETAKASTGGGDYPNYMKVGKMSFDNVSPDRFVDMVRSQNNRKYDLSQVRTASHVQKLIDDGIDVPDDVLKKFDKVRSKKGNAEKIEANRKAFKEIEDMLAKIDQPVMSDTDAKGHKPMMTEKEAANYARDSVFGDTSMFHGASGASIERKTTEGIDMNRVGRGAFGEGFYLTPVEKEADLYSLAGKRQGEPAYLEAKVKTKKPFIVTQDEYRKLENQLDDLNESGREGEWANKFLRTNGYDSVYVKDIGYFVAFDGRQVATYKTHKSKLDKDPTPISQETVNDWVKQNRRLQELKRMGG